MLNMPNSVELLRQMLINERCLSNEAEVAMFSAPNSVELVKTYISYYPLSRRGQEMMLKHENLGEIWAMYIQKHWRYLTADDMRRIMDHPNAKNLAWVLMRHVPCNNFPMSVVYDMCALDINLIDTYIRKVSWDELNLFIESIEPYHENAERAMVLALTYRRDLQLNEDQQKAILRLKNAEELIRIYVHNERKVSLKDYYRRFRLCDEFVEKMATMSDGAELMNICIKYDLM